MNDDDDKPNHEIVNLSLVDTDDEPPPSKKSNTVSCLNNPSFLQTLIRTSQQGVVGDQPLQILHTTTEDGTTAAHINISPESFSALDGIVIAVAPSSVGDDQSDELAGKIWQVVPTTGNSTITHIISMGQIDNVSMAGQNEENEAEQTDENLESSLSAETLASMLLSTPIMSHPLPSDAPSWALKLNECEVIGDSYRGWVLSEAELDLILTFHKQQTHSFWGTRQSPNSKRPSTRLMWKSQYVPFDGIPFINAGSRAVVMECQYGPRRKGHPTKRQADVPFKSEFRQTCPARIYIKKVRKFPQFGVELNSGRKYLRVAMDRAFQDLKTHGFEGHGEDRWYVQLPTIEGHEFHEVAKKIAASKISNSTTVSRVKQPSHAAEEAVTPFELSEPTALSRVHPQIVEKIQELVQKGESRVYAIRKQLRRFVEKDLAETLYKVPDRHNLCFFPTVHDIQNHVFRMLKEIDTGVIPRLDTNVAALDSETSTDGNSLDQRLTNISNATVSNSDLDFRDENGLLVGPSSNVTSEGTDKAQPEMVTLTLTQSEGGEGGHLISKIVTHLSDGTTHVSTALSAETAQLLSKLHPDVFGSNFLQVHAAVPEQVKLDSINSPDEDQLALAAAVAVADVPDDALPLLAQPTAAADGDDTRVITMTVDEGGEILHIENLVNDVKDECLATTEIELGD